jgi:hypothetical protein
MMRFSADAWSWLTAPDVLVTWGAVLRPMPGAERELFPGVLPVSLALAAAVVGLRRWRSAPRATSPRLFALGCCCLAVYLSLGPEPRAGGQRFDGPAVYAWLLEAVPGLDGLRVPARFAMVAMFFLTVAAAFGARDLFGRFAGPDEEPADGPASAVSPRAALLLALVSTAWMVEARVAPLPVNGRMPSDVAGVLDPPGRIAPASRMPAVYRFVRRLPVDTVLVEFPFGVVAWELQYVYASTFHWHPLVNGFSGYSPPSYLARVELLLDPTREPDAAWDSVLRSGATHAIVHGSAYVGSAGPATHAWLASHGATLVREVGSAAVFAIPRGAGSPPRP